MNEREFVTVLLRMVERISSIGIAAMTIYFGYRLFTLLPTETTGDGKIELPNFSVVLTKLGPGVFFVALGVVVLYQSLSSPIKVDATSFSGTIERDPAGNLGQVAATTNDPQRAARLRRDIQVLNCVQSLMAGGGRGVGADDLDRAVGDAKAALAKAGGDASLTGDDRVEGCGAPPPPATRPR